MALGMNVCLSPGDFVLDGDPAPIAKKGTEPPPDFRPISLRPNGWMHQDTNWFGGRPQLRGLCVRWRPSPLSRKGQFSAHVYCGQTAAWIKMPLGTEVGLGPDDIVLDGDPISPIFGPCLLWPNGWSPLPNFRPMSIVAKRLDGSRWHLAWRWALVQATLY